MCLAVPARVMSVSGSTGRVDISGNTLEVDLSLLDHVAVGDHVIVHAGLAIEKYDPEEAARTIELLRRMAGAGGAP